MRGSRKHLLLEDTCAVTSVSSLAESKVCVGMHGAPCSARLLPHGHIGCTTQCALRGRQSYVIRIGWGSRTHTHAELRACCCRQACSACSGREQPAPHV